MKTIEVKTMYKDVKNELPTNTFECIVKMWNQFNDTWVTGIGIYDIQQSNGKYERMNLVFTPSIFGLQYPTFNTKEK